MEINKPDRGVFKGMGRLQIDDHVNKKHYPKTRNIHQFQYTHQHPNDYLSSFERFFSTKHKQSDYAQKTKSNTNQSTFQLGQDRNNYYNSLAKTDYKKFDKYVPPRLIRQKEEGILLGDQNTDRLKQFTTTSMATFGQREFKEKANVTFKDRGIDRFNPITGEKRNLAFGFEDFTMNRDNSYKANNGSIIPKMGEKFDIISGRKIICK